MPGGSSRVCSQKILPHPGLALSESGHPAQSSLQRLGRRAHPGRRAQPRLSRRGVRACSRWRPRDPADLALIMGAVRRRQRAQSARARRLRPWSWPATASCSLTGPDVIQAVTGEQRHRALEHGAAPTCTWAVAAWRTSPPATAGGGPRPRQASLPPHLPPEQQRGPAAAATPAGSAHADGRRAQRADPGGREPAVRHARRDRDAS